MPTYKLILQLKSESPDRFHSIILILGAFNQQMSYMYTIYKRFKGSGMADTLVVAGVITSLAGKTLQKGSEMHNSVARGFNIQKAPRNPL